MGVVRDVLRQVYIRNPLGQFEVTAVLVGLPAFLVYAVSAVFISLVGY